jgi:hypothetical protein
MRDNWLSNRIFESYDDILDHCCFAWNKLIDMPWKIISIGTRDWAYRSCEDVEVRVSSQEAQMQRGAAPGADADKPDIAEFVVSRKRRK